MRAFIILFTLTLFVSCKNEVKEIVTMKEDVFVLANALHLDTTMVRSTNLESPRLLE